MSPFDAERRAQLDAFVQAHGHDPADLAPLAGDASMRRYLRLADHRGSRVVMDAPPASNERMDPFVDVTAILRAQGLSAPALCGSDLDRGFLLLEDLGDALYARVMAATPSSELPLYAAAVDLLADLPPVADIAHPALPRIGPYDAEAYRREARLAVDWYAAGVGSPLAEDLLSSYDALIDAAMAALPALPPVLVMRDYHAENLIWLPDRAGRARVGLLDYQDALIGHPAYDLVSLLEDARRDVDPDLAAAMMRRFVQRQGMDRADVEAFGAAYDLLGAQRNLKIIGIFARLALRDGKPRYVDLIPRVWRYLQRDLAGPGCGALAGFVANTLPPPEPALLDRLKAAAGSRSGAA
ncbi:MAG: phosphotransferase [Pseudomonadota bacterium]